MLTGSQTNRREGCGTCKPLKHTLLFKRIARRLRFGHIDNAVHVEGYLLVVCGPVLVTEAVHIFSIEVRIEGVVA